MTIDVLEVAFESGKVLIVIDRLALSGFLFFYGYF